MTHYNIPVFVPHMGCPHDCVFCSQNTITGKEQRTTPDSAREIIDTYLLNVKPKGYVEIAFFGGSFTGISDGERIPLLKLAKEYIDNGLVQGIRLSTRPDYISSQILCELKEYGVTAIELGVQSMCDEVLTKSGRGHSSHCVRAAAALIKDYGFELGLQMMTGLPGDSFESSLDTARQIASMNPDTVRVYPTLVISGTALERLLNEGKYIPWSVEETTDLLADITEIFDTNNIKIIRMGLQTTEEISPNGAVVAGPFHEAIGEMARNKVFYKKLLELLKDFKQKEAVILCNKKDVSKIVGHKKCNIERLHKELNIKLKLKPEADMEEGKLRLLR